MRPARAAAVVDYGSLEIHSAQAAIVPLGPGTSDQLPAVMNRLGFAFQRSEAGTNRGLYAPRFPAIEYPVTAHRPTRSTEHGLVAVLPGKSPGTTPPVVASSFKMAIASVLTIPAELDPLSRFLDEQKTEKYFGAVIRYERDGERVLDARPVAARKVAFNVLILLRYAAVTARYRLRYTSSVVGDVKK